MKTRSLLRTAAPAAALSALLLVTACGSDDPGPDPEPTSSETSEQEDESGLSKSDLEDALLTEDDVADLGDDLEEVKVDKSTLSGDDLISGDDACVTFLDEEYGAEEEEKATTQFDGSDVKVYSTVELYAEGEAEEELEAVRDLFADCTTFTLDADGQELTIDAKTIDLDELDGYDLGDEGVAIDLTFTLDGTEVQRQGFTLIRIDDVLTISGAAVQGTTLGDDIMLTITEAAADRLQTVLDDAA